MSFLPTRPSPTLLLCSTLSSGDSNNSNSAVATTTSNNHNQKDNAVDLSTEDRKNKAYVESLIDNLMNLLDKWIMTGSPATKQGAYNVLQQIHLHARDPEMVAIAQRKMQRAGLPPILQNNNISSSSKTTKELGKTDDTQRRLEAEQRKEWEASRQLASKQKAEKNGRSALSRRQAQSNGNKPDIFMGEVDPNLVKEARFANDKMSLEDALQKNTNNNKDNAEDESPYDYLRQELDVAASNKVSEFVARAGAQFDGQILGIGGLDDVLAQVKRRVWTPLAAPPILLKELGIAPVRGLLLYGRPGCGKTLLARTLGQILSPLRPITVVSGPEIMDKFVGSSEMNLRELFDKPPDIYDFFKQREDSDALGRAALHVIIMDEFDAIARHRGGRGGSGDQGDAGVARDSVVNQLLAKMDGVAPLVVPTLVIGLTNKRSLVDSALLRPGRFEVQIEVPPPRTVEQRISILKVHTRNMQEAGRLLVRDAPPGTAAAAHEGKEKLLTYEEMLKKLAEETDGFTGASLAAMARAAASHALERAVEDFALHYRNGHSILSDCIVGLDDFEDAKKDFENLNDSDYSELNDDSELVEEVDDKGNEEDDKGPSQ